MKTLLLTWWAGYIWSHTAVLLLEKWYDIIILDNLSNSSRKVLTNIEKITEKSPIFIEWDTRNIADIEKVFAENSIDGVIHFAGLKSVEESCEKPFLYYENNIVWSLQLLTIMEKYNCKNIIFSSTATVCSPESPVPYTENTPIGNTSNPYASSKFIIETILRDMSLYKDFRVCNLRYFNPIGAHSSGLIGENPHWIPNNLLPYVMKVASGELGEISIYWDDYDTLDGTGVRDYLHVCDLAQAHVQWLSWLEESKKKWCFETFHLGIWQWKSVKEIIRYSEEVSGKILPYKIAPRRAWDIWEFYCSPKKTEKTLGWKAQKTVKQAIKDSWNFIKNKEWK